MTNKIKKLKRSLKINKIIGVSFSEKLPEKFNIHKDTACTALARAFIKNETLIFDAKKYPQLCSGASYFLKLEKIKDDDAKNIYTKDEHVFENKNVCSKFLKELPKFPEKLKNKFIILKEFNLKENFSTVIFLVTPSQAGRILGLANYSKFETIKINPNQPTCISLFAPLVTKNIHINFLDYYDRYYQGKVNGKYIWPEEKMIISLRKEDFIKMIENLDKSPQGNFEPKLNPKKIDRI